MVQAPGRMVQDGNGKWRFYDGRVYANGGPPVNNTTTSKPPTKIAPKSRYQRGVQTWSSGLSGNDRNAASALVALFESYGLGSLAGKIVEYVKKGWGSDTVMLELQSTDEWKRRFAGNEARRKARISVLSPSEYLATERAYRQVLNEYGFPKGFYDSTDDFAKMIGGDLSPSELQERAQTVTSYINTKDQSTKDALRQMYGLGTGDLAALALDQTRALPLLRKQMQAVSIGAEAQRQGLGYSTGKSEMYADMGITAEQARQGYSTIAEYLPVLNELGSIYGQDYTQGNFEDEVFEGKGADKRKGLASRERAEFGGSSRGSVGSSSSGY